MKRTVRTLVVSSLLVVAGGLAGTALSRRTAPAAEAESTARTRVTATSRTISPLDDPELWRRLAIAGERRALMQGIDRSLHYLNTRGGALAYRRLQNSTGITRERTRRSLRRFRGLLKCYRSSSLLRAELEREFAFYQPKGQPPVHFTGYYAPVQTASRVATSLYRYPIYRRPAGFARWGRPHPTRLQLEGADGLHPSLLLRGAELAWLADRLEAYLLQVQGSGRLRLTDGRSMSIGYGGHTDWPYVSMGRQLVADGHIEREELTMQTLRAFFSEFPEALDSYLPRNSRFVFFRNSRGAPPSGSLGVALTPECSIATDRSRMPPAALSVMRVELTNPQTRAVFGSPTFTRFVLHHDAGTAIKGAGRVDIFMGTGKQAGERAGALNSMGQIWFLVLKK